jgi:hypothetical protein
MFAFFAGTILSLIYEGAFLGQTDYGVLGTLTQWTSQGFSFWRIPIVLGSFILALPQMIAWDYGFFASLGAAGSFMRLFLFVVISIGFVWGFFTILFPIALSFVINIARGLIGLARFR